jgi:uncharacterized membrane protein (UPF0127 family)
MKTASAPALGALMIAVVLMGCSEPARTAREPQVSSDPQPAAAPAVGLPRAVLADGTEITLELALTPDELATGLMFRPSLAPDRGMLLLFGIERYASIWMKNTLMDLDLIFLDNDGVVVDVIQGVPPCAAEPCPTYSPAAPARAVLEMAAGGAERYGIAAGDRLTFDRVPGYPVSNSEF